MSPPDPCEPPETPTPAAPRLSDSHYDSFVVRLRSEAGSGIVSGQVTHVGSRQSMYFTKLAALLRFVRLNTGRRGGTDGDSSR
jgi:hypothetical protein